MYAKQSLDFNRVVPIFALVFVDVLGLTVILPLLHLYAAAYGATPLQIGLVVAAFPLAQLIGVPVMGSLSDRYGRKPLLLISQITTCIGFIMLGLANSLTLIILSRIIDGLFGANLATAQAALSDITTEKNRAQGLGITGAAFGLGFIFGPVIALVTLEFTDNLQIPALVAAGYSFLSILLTLFMFDETLPPEKRMKTAKPSPFASFSRLMTPNLVLLLVVMFAQQVIFFMFESFLGLFTLSRLGLLGQGNALIFIVVGLTLVTVQVRYIGRWTRQYGERKVIFASLLLLTAGMILFALTPERPHPFYVKRIVENKLSLEAISSTEALIGELNVPLPDDGHNGFIGLAWVFVVIIPISIGAGLIRPSLNSLMTKGVDSHQFGSILGISAAFVSAANAVAPLWGGVIFQTYGANAPFLIGGVTMGLLLVVSWLVLRPVQQPTPEES